MPQPRRALPGATMGTEAVDAQKYSTGKPGRKILGVLASTRDFLDG